MSRILLVVVLVAGFFTRPAADAAITLPNVPDSLTSAQQRAEYLLHHFRDNIPDDSTLFTNPEMMQVFVHTASYCRDSVATIEYRRLLHSSFSNPDYYSSLMYHLDYIMGDPASEYRNDLLMGTLLEDVLESSLPDDYKIWPRAKLQEVKRNRIGSKCADIEITTTSRDKTDLYGYADKRLLLVFASSTCPDCHRLLKTLPEDKPFNDFIRSSKLQVVTIYIDGKMPQDLSFPSDWIVGVDTKRRILDAGAYSAHHLPSFYIIDSGGVVEAKELTLKQLFAKYVNP